MMMRIGGRPVLAAAPCRGWPHTDGGRGARAERLRGRSGRGPHTVRCPGGSPAVRACVRAPSEGKARKHARKNARAPRPGLGRGTRSPCSPGLSPAPVPDLPAIGRWALPHAAGSLPPPPGAHVSRHGGSHEAGERASVRPSSSSAAATAAPPLTRCGARKARTAGTPAG
eukprot:scaffold179_cov368-Prasinococcus_capsulatus_cf.AAC.23